MAQWWNVVNLEFLETLSEKLRQVLFPFGQLSSKVRGLSPLLF